MGRAFVFIRRFALLAGVRLGLARMRRVDSSEELRETLNEDRLQLFVYILNCELVYIISAAVLARGRPRLGCGSQRRRITLAFSGLRVPSVRFLLIDTEGLTVSACCTSCGPWPYPCLGAESFATLALGSSSTARSSCAKDQGSVEPG